MTDHRPRKQLSFSFDDGPDIEPFTGWPGGKHFRTIGTSTRDQPDGRIQGVPSAQTRRAAKAAKERGGNDIPF